MKKIKLVVISTICLVLYGLMIANAAEITLAWDANVPAPTGYRLYSAVFGDSFDYTTPLYDGIATTATVIVPDNAEYKFVVRAYVIGESGTVYESGNSNQVNHAVVVWMNPNLRIQ